MKNWWKKVKEFFSRSKVIKWTIAILTLLIVTGSIKALVWTIYTKDKPDFIPEKVREDIQGVINESGEAIKTISDHIGTAIVDAGYEKPDSTPEMSDPIADSVANWETYTNKELGITLKYPGGLNPDYSEGNYESYVGTVTLWKNTDINFDIDIFNSNEQADDWVNALAIDTELITEITTVTIGSQEFIRAIEAGDPDHYIYVISDGVHVFKYKTLFENQEDLLDVLTENFK